MDVSGIKTKNNAYDFLIVFFLCLMVFGGIGGPMQPVRIFVILCSPYTLIHFINNRKITFHYQYEIFLFVFWISYGLVTLFWSIIILNSIKEMLYLMLNFFGFLTLIYFANKASNPYKSILKGWLLLFLLTLPIALCELWFDFHLPLSFTDKGLMVRFGSFVFHRRFASVTYGNINGYNTLLCYILPFIFAYSVWSLSKIKTIIIWLLIVCLSYIVVVNGSRGATLSLVLGYIVYAAYYLKRKSVLITLSVILLIVVFVSVNYYDEVFTLIFKRFNALGITDPGRLQLVKCGFDALSKSFMLGIGAGNFMTAMNSIYHLKVTAPHNLFLEIGVQFGVIVLMLFVGMIIRLFLKQRHNHNKLSKFLIISSLIMFPLTSVIDSSYILSIVIWLFLASLYVIADKQYYLT